MGDFKSNVALTKKLHFVKYIKETIWGPFLQSRNTGVSPGHCRARVAGAPGRRRGRCSHRLHVAVWGDSGQSSRPPGKVPAPGLTTPADRRYRNAPGLARGGKKNGTSASFPRPLLPSGAAGPALAAACSALSHLGAQRGSAGRADACPAEAGRSGRGPGARSCPGPPEAPRPCSPHLPGEAAANPPRPAPSRRRLRLGPPAPLGAAGSPRLRARARPLLPGAPAPRVPSPAAAARPCPKARFQVWPPRENGARNREPGARPSCSRWGGTCGEEGGARWTPAPRRTRTWSRDVPGMGTWSGRPRPVVLPSPPRSCRSVARLCSRGPRRPVSRPGRPRPPEGPVLCNCARGPGGAEEKDEWRPDPRPQPRPGACGPLSGSEGSGAGFRVVISAKASHLFPWPLQCFPQVCRLSGSGEAVIRRITHDPNGQFFGPLLTSFDWQKTLEGFRETYTLRYDLQNLLHKVSLEVRILSAIVT